MEENLYSVFSKMPEFGDMSESNLRDYIKKYIYKYSLNENCEISFNTYQNFLIFFLEETLHADKDLENAKILEEFLEKREQEYKYFLNLIYEREQELKRQNNIFCM